MVYVVHTLTAVLTRIANPTIEVALARLMSWSTVNVFVGPLVTRAVPLAPWR